MRTILVLAWGLAAAGGWCRLAVQDDPAALLKKTGYSLGDALAKAGKQAEGLPAVLAELEEEDGRLVYSIEFAQGTKILEVNLDAKTGELVKKEPEDEDKSAAARACTVPLSKAVESALQKVPGAAFAAEAALKEGKPEIQVKIVSEGKIHKVLIDGATGAVLKVKSKAEVGK